MLNPVQICKEWKSINPKFFFNYRYKSGALLTRLCQYTTENFATYEMAHEVENFFKENFNPAERTIRQCVENISLNAKWHAKDGNNIRNYFAAM